MKKIIALLFLSLFFPWVVNAQSSDSFSRGLSLTPFLLELEVEKGGSIKSEVEISNNTGSPLVITVQPRDFLPGKEGQPVFVPDAEINDSTYSLASWVNLVSSNRFTLQPNQTMPVVFTLQPPLDAEQGTHYGALLFSYSATNSQNEIVDITQSVGSILLVRYGQAREGGAVNLNVPKNLFWNTDRISLLSVFTNSGNVHVKPKGEVYVRNIFGKIVATSFVNRDAVNVLPQTERSFAGSWVPSSYSFGRYTLDAVITYGNSRLEARDREVIWVLPFYIVVVIGIAIAVMVWFVIHGRHWYKRRIILKHLNINKMVK